MTDGTTGFHVAPITEDEMSKVQAILKRAADAIVGMSQLHADVDMLRQTVASLQADTDRLRSQNNALDEALNHSRSVRDQQGQRIDELNQGLAETERRLIEVTDERNKLTLSNQQYHDDLEAAHKAKDDAEFRALELEDKLASAEAKLAKVAELHRTLFPVEAPPTTPYPQPATAPVEPTTYSTDPVYMAEPAPTNAPKPWLPDSIDNWEPGYYWDSATGKYWREGVTPTKPDGEQIPF